MQLSKNIPSPDVMPVDRQQWAQELNLSNFINTYYQYCDLQRLDGVRSVLVVGPGQGLDTQVLRWRGYRVTTLDIDPTFKPDYLGSVHDLNMFADGEFDAVIASHVLEHLAVPYLDASLKEIARVGRFALIYLPVYGLHLRLRLTSNFHALDLTGFVGMVNFFEKPDGMTPRYMNGQHFWEIGLRGFTLRDMARRMAQFFEVLSVYRNRDWFVSQNFVLKSKLVSR